MQRDHLASDSLVLNASASSKYFNIVSGGGGQPVAYHNPSASLPAPNSLPSKAQITHIQKLQHQQQSPNKDYVQINPPAVAGIYANQNTVQHQSQSSSPSRLSRQYNHQSPTKSIGSAGSRTAIDDINGSDYVCMSGGTLTKKLQQVNKNQISTSQVVFQRPPPIPPLTNINLKTNYTTPANELPQAQYSTAADQQIDAIAAAKSSVNLNKISDTPPAVKTSSPTPSTGSTGKSINLINHAISLS